MSNQSEKLFNDTIYNNIVFGQEVSMEKIEEISKVCKVEDILEKRDLIRYVYFLFFLKYAINDIDLEKKSSICPYFF